MPTLRAMPIGEIVVVLFVPFVFAVPLIAAVLGERRAPDD